MSDHCATCRHYEPPNEWDDRVGRTMGTCALGESKDDEPEHPESTAVAYDTEGYHAWLRVSPEHGCVQHSPT